LQFTSAGKHVNASDMRDDRGAAYLTSAGRRRNGR